MYELRDAYTQAIFVGTRNEARKSVEEIRQWMRANAPWKDISGDARRGLYAEIKDELGYEARMDFEAQRIEARVRDTKKLKAINRELRKAKEPLLDVLPNYMSTEHELVTTRNKSEFPILTLRIGHNQELPYALWLEIANQGRYGIISRTLDYWGTKFINRIKSSANLGHFTYSPGEETTFQGVKTTSFSGFVESQNRGYNTYQPYTSEVKSEKERRKGYRKRKAKGQTRRYNKSGKYSKNRYRGPKK